MTKMCWFEKGSQAIAASDCQGAAGRAGHAAVALDADRILISGGLKQVTNGRLDLVLVNLNKQNMTRWLHHPYSFLVVTL